MTRRRAALASSALALGLALALALATCGGRQIPPATPHAFVPPPPPPATGRLQACWVEFGRSTTRASHSRAGWSHRPGWEVTVSGLVLRHPRGHLVLDVGNSSRFRDEIRAVRWAPRLLLREGPGSVAVLAHAPEALRAIGEDPATLTVVLSHVHPDHAGALADLATSPVYLAAEELAFAQNRAADRGAQVVPATAAALGERARAIPFAPRPYATFDESWDIFGDGSVVAVKLFGHTPGSIGVFVQLPDGRRLFHVGDAITSEEQLDARVGKALLMGWTDNDQPGADRVVARLAQLHAQDPSLVILPAHDRVVWQRLFGAPGCAAEATR